MQKSATNSTFVEQQFPNLGRHLILDFANVQKVNLDSLEEVQRLFDEAMKAANVAILNKQFKKFEPQGLTVIYLLVAGHLTIHTWPESSACAIDFYIKGPNTIQTARIVEEKLCDSLGWQSCASTLVLPRGTVSRLYCNENDAKCEIINHVKLVHREKTKYQDLRIFDTKYMGRIMVLDGQIQFSDTLDDNYTVDMTKEVIKKDTEYDHILIIGGGDILIANYLLENFPKIKKITVCDIDDRVTANVLQYFAVGEKLNQLIKSGKLQVVHEDGAAFAKKLASSNNHVDAIVVDCTDVWFPGAVASSLFTVEFYTSLHSCLKKGGGFSQQISFKKLIESFQQKVKEAGFINVNFIYSNTPEYGEDLPIAVCVKQ